MQKSNTSHRLILKENNKYMQNKDSPLLGHTLVCEKR